MRRLVVAVILIAGCRSTCGKTSGGPIVEVTPIHPGPTAEDPPPVVPDAGPVTAASDELLLSFDATGKKLRVVGNAIRIYDVATKKLESEHERPPGMIEAHSGNVFVVSDAKEEDHKQHRHWLVDILTGKSSELPSSWFPLKEANWELKVSLSAHGERIAISDTGIHKLSSSVYDTNRRELVGTVTQNVGEPAQLAFEGKLAPDGKSVTWCHLRFGPCTIQPLDGGPKSSISRWNESSLAWTLEIPVIKRGDESVLQPIRVRDAAGQIMGKLDVPVEKDANGNGGLVPYTMAICPSDRAVVTHQSTLYVLHLPDGKRLLTKKLEDDTDTAQVVCSGAHAAYLDHDSGPLPFTVIDLPR